jgi:hypothetical protein
MRFTLTAVMLAALAAACGEKPATTDGATPAVDAAAPAPAAASAAAAPGIEGPAAGKWSITMTTMGQTMPPTEVCYDKQVSLAEAEQMQRRSGVTCSEQSYKREGDAWVGHSVCAMDAQGMKMTVTSDTRVSGDFSSKYTMEMTNKMDPAPMPGMEEQKMTMTAERVGDC